MALTSNNPIAIPDAGNFIAYGLSFYPLANTNTGRVTIYRRQYRCNSDGSGVVWIGDGVTESHKDIVADATNDAVLSTFWAAATALATTLGTAKNITVSNAAPLGFQLSPLSKAGSITAILRLFTGSKMATGFFTGDVFASIVAGDTNLAACVAPLEADMSVLSIARGW